MSEAVVVFGKPARPGRVKTRLTPPVSARRAAELYDAFARDVMVTAQRFAEARRAKGHIVRTVLAWAGEDESSPLAKFAATRLGFEIVGQGDGDLGDRLCRVSSRLRGDGSDQLIVIGSDSPTLSTEHLDSARLHLEASDVVFGPSFDGGYYLVGMGESGPSKPAVEEVIFDGISWSSRRVLEQSWRRATDGGLLCELLGFWYDVDTFDDLRMARFHLVEYLADRDPLVGQYTRKLLESQSVIDEE